jgi:hypothetical protein
MWGEKERERRRDGERGREKRRERERERERMTDMGQLNSYDTTRKELIC